MKKIAILYICTGKYKIFWQGFKESAQKFLLPKHDRTFFVFTDAEDITPEENVVIIDQKKLGWPYDTLFRFDLFLKVEEQLSAFDYIYFFNANMLFLDYINEEILPTSKENNLVGVLHPGYYAAKKSLYPYEKNKKSLAYIPYKNRKYYYMGSFNGGGAKEYILLAKTLSNNIKRDLQNEIIAVWHDESHLNHYYSQRNVLALSPEYAYPETLPEAYNLSKNLKPKILLLDKNKWGGHDFLRDSKESIAIKWSLKARVIVKIKKLFKIT